MNALTTKVGENTVEITQRLGIDPIPGIIYARIVGPENSSVYVEEKEIEKILGLMNDLRVITSKP